MKLKTILLTIAIALGITSCSNEDISLVPSTQTKEQELKALSIEECHSLNQNSGETLSEEEVLSIAQEFVGDINVNSISVQQKMSSRTSDGNFSFRIKKSYPLNDNLQSRSTAIIPSIFELQIINSDGTEGLMLVGGDDRLPAVIAYIPIQKNGEQHNDENSNKTGGHERMLDLAKYSYVRNLQKISSA